MLIPSASSRWRPLQVIKQRQQSARALVDKNCALLGFRPIPAAHGAAVKAAHVSSVATRLRYHTQALRCLKHHTLWQL